MEFKPTSGLESTTSPKNRNFTRQQAEIKDKQKIPAQDSSTSNNQVARTIPKTQSMLSISLSDKSIDYSLQKAEIKDKQKMPFQDSSTSNNQVARKIPKIQSMLSISLSDKSIDYSLQKAEIKDKQKMPSQDLSTSNNQVARTDSKPRPRLEHSKSNESKKNIIDILHKKEATEQDISQFKEHTTSLYQKTLDMWKNFQTDEFSSNDRFKSLQTTIQVSDLWYQVHKEQATEQDISQFKEHTTSLYQQTLDIWKNSQTDEFSRDDRLKLLQTTIQVFELWYQVYKEQATEQDISQFKEHTTSLYQQTKAFSEEILGEYRSEKITHGYYLEADKNAMNAFNLWRKANIE